MNNAIIGAKWEDVSAHLQAGLDNVAERIYHDTVYVSATTVNVYHNSGVKPDRIIFEPLGVKTYYATEAQRRQWNENSVVFTASGTGEYVIVHLERY